MKQLISYAQNFEDVMLWRALQHIENGFYIDIGAYDPIIDSVSKLFHDRGWNGVHVEPNFNFARKLKAERPGDTVLQVALREKGGIVDYYIIEDTGLSTTELEVVRQHRTSYADEKIVIPAITLDTILNKYQDQDIHWLKVDVEGAERAAFSGWKVENNFPWIVVVESIDPINQEDSSQEWEEILLNKGYTQVYKDGINRFYLHNKQSYLKKHFEFPPNVLDRFALADTMSSSFSLLYRAKMQALNEKWTKGYEGLKQANTSLEKRLTDKITSLEQNTNRLKEDKERVEIQQLAVEQKLITYKNRVKKTEVLQLQLQEKVKVLENEKIQLNQQLSEKEQQLKRQWLELQEQARIKDDRGEKLDLLKKRLVQKDKQLKIQKFKIRQELELNEVKTNLVEDLRNKLSQKEKELHDQYHSLREQLLNRESYLNDRLKSLAEEIKNRENIFNGELFEVSQRFEHARLKYVNAESYIKALRNSISWKITYPLRKLYELIFFPWKTLKRSMVKIGQATGKWMRSSTPRLYSLITRNQTFTRYYEQFVNQVMLSSSDADAVKVLQPDPLPMYSNQQSIGININYINLKRERLD